MRSLRITASTFTLCLLPLVATIAGPNEGGYLLFHTDDSVIYSDDDYCGGSGLECPDDFDGPPYDFENECQELLQQVNPTSGLGFETAVAWVLGAFPPGSSPRVTAAQFGIRWDGSVSPTFVAWSQCGNLEIASDGWPMDPESGTAVSWGLGDPQLRQAVEIYWFATYSYYGPVEIEITAPPFDGTNGAAFADDAIPPSIDPVAADHLGSLGLNGASGHNPYPPFGACCSPDETCRLATDQTCTGNDVYLGDDVSCDPNPCETTPVVETSWGQLKRSYR